LLLVEGIFSRIDWVTVVKFPEASVYSDSTVEARETRL